MKKLYLVILSVIIVSGLSCEYTFEPLQESNYNFSMYGYLDLYSRFNRIRVSPVRETIISFEDSIDAKVTLTRENSGSESDFLGYKFTRFVDGKQVYYWNFFTEDSLRGGEVYIVRATNAEGESSTVSVQMPDDFPDPVSQYFDDSSYKSLVTGTGVKDLVVVERFYDLRYEGGSIWVTVSEIDSNRVVINENGDFRITVDDRAEIIENIPVPLNQIRVEGAFIIIVSGNESWPDFKETDEEAALQDVQRNVTNGLGVIAGVAIRAISLEPCYNESGDVTACSAGKVNNQDLLIHSRIFSAQEY